MATTQRTRTAPKTVAPVAPKAAPKTAAKTKTVGTTLYHLTAIGRPAHGGRLYAHTMAALTVLGMFGRGRPAVAESILTAFIGKKAVDYHTDTKLSMQRVGEKVRLTAEGVPFFRDRAMKADEVEGFESVFRTGKANDAAGVKQSHIQLEPITL